MEGIIGLALLALVGYAIIKMTRKTQAEPEVVPEPVVAKVEEIKPAPVASLEPVVSVAREEVKANIDAKIEEAFFKSIQEEIKKVEVIAEPVVEEVKVATKKVRAKAKAIEAAVEEKVEQLEVAVKKTRAKKAK
jgi:hypothetical protein